MGYVFEALFRKKGELLRKIYLKDSNREAHITRQMVAKSPNLVKFTTPIIRVDGNKELPLATIYIMKAEKNGKAGS